MKNTTTKPIKKKRFFFHYYKAESIKQGRNVMTIHWEDTCHMVNFVKTHGADIETHDQKKQPRCIMRGFAKAIVFADSPKGIVAHIHG
jgi:hypothetical protein